MEADMLETTWFVIWGILWAVYFMLDGFDLGIGSLMPVLTHSDSERRLAYNAMGPFWDGNEVWLITAGGVTFAAFPGTYAVMFSTLYSPLMLILFALILRGISFEFRGKLENRFWKTTWDSCMIIGSFAPALLFGVAFANIFQGIPFDQDGRFVGSLLTLLNPYGILGGILFLVLFLVHGSLWLVVKTENDLHRKALSMARLLWPVLVITLLTFLVATRFSTSLYDNYFKYPMLLIIPVLTVTGLLLSRIWMGGENPWKAWAASSLTIASAVLFGVSGLYPNLFPSSLDPTYSMTIRNSSSSPLTLKIMLMVVLILVPIVIAYQTWVYILFKNKITEKDLHY